MGQKSVPIATRNIPRKGIFMMKASDINVLLAADSSSVTITESGKIIIKMEKTGSQDYATVLMSILWLF
ncbi:MAG: hypothetical protein C0399_08090 [Syntrophus sp. (in: bacteria)]|nr:hypothetical protein [Syntrophus sp. (in: bacteria)]